MHELHKNTRHSLQTSWGDAWFKKGSMSFPQDYQPCSRFRRKSLEGSVYTGSWWSDNNMLRWSLSGHNAAVVFILLSQIHLGGWPWGPLSLSHRRWLQPVFTYLQLVIHMYLRKPSSDKDSINEGRLAQDTEQTRIPFREKLWCG